MTHHTAVTTSTGPVIGTMNAAQLAEAQADTMRALAASPAHPHARPGSRRRLPAYCGCCGCITRYCICSCCCQK